MASQSSGTDQPALRQNANAVVAPFPGLTLSVVNRGVLLPAELSEAPAPGGRD
ncbi:hypothetical protein [Massilia sp. DWR3-1-1]|uniref:hypothetical protein n=1 Tax=Massilia sp. DWR3-1-1 TaxID=2804559 RepID=UPI003CF59D25